VRSVGQHRGITAQRLAALGHLNRWTTKGLPISVVVQSTSTLCTSVAANGRTTVKLSDNPEKAMGPRCEIARYKRIFGVDEQEPLKVVV